MTRSPQPAATGGLRQVIRVTAPVREQLLEMLRDAILSFEWHPGDRMIERDICERTGASRPSVREALRQLEAEGLVTVVPNRGPIVAVVSEDEATDIYELREVLEPLATKHFVARATDEDIQRLRESFDAVESALGRGDRAGALSAKNAFYDILLGTAGNTAIHSTLKQIQTRVNFLRATSMTAPGRDKAMISEIRLVIEAIEARNSALAVKAMRTHVRAAAKAARVAMRAMRVESADTA